MCWNVLWHRLAHRTVHSPLEATHHSSDIHYSQPDAQDFSFHSCILTHYFLYYSPLGYSEGTTSHFAMYIVTHTTIHPDPWPTHVLLIMMIILKSNNNNMTLLLYWLVLLLLFLLLLWFIIFYGLTAVLLPTSPPMFRPIKVPLCYDIGVMFVDVECFEPPLYPSYFVEYMDHLNKDISCNQCVFIMYGVCY